MQQFAIEGETAQEGVRRHARHWESTLIAAGEILAAVVEGEDAAAFQQPPGQGSVGQTGGGVVIAIDVNEVEVLGVPLTYFSR